MAEYPQTKPAQETNNPDGSQIGGGALFGISAALGAVAYAAARLLTVGVSKLTAKISSAAKEAAK